jgi:hypothetical protein
MDSDLATAADELAGRPLLEEGKRARGGDRRSRAHVDHARTTITRARRSRVHDVTVLDPPISAGSQVNAFDRLGDPGRAPEEARVLID